jgi:hypothetical protein
MQTDSKSGGIRQTLIVTKLDLLFHMACTWMFTGGVGCGRQQHQWCKVDGCSGVAMGM